MTVENIVIIPIVVVEGVFRNAAAPVFEELTAKSTSSARVQPVMSVRTFGHVTRLYETLWYQSASTHIYVPTGHMKGVHKNDEVRRRKISIGTHFGYFASLNQSHLQLQPFFNTSGSPLH
jgi:hypothetical protein